jgi:uncharacterized protein GlcG (DUF336 family)
MRSKIFGALLCTLSVTGFGSAHADDATFEMTVMTPETALRIAKAALESCRAKGYQVAVTVVDRMGVSQAMIRDRFAGPHTPDTSFRKAWTAVSFRGDTVGLAANTAPGTPQSGARDIKYALMLGGGVPIEAGGSIVGGVGISGAPNGEADDACARAGIEAVIVDLEM